MSIPKLTPSTLHIQYEFNSLQKIFSFELRKGSKNSIQIHIQYKFNSLQKNNNFELKKKDSNNSIHINCQELFFGICMPQIRMNISLNWFHM